MSRDARLAARGFDPVVLARLESAAWIGYYRREWSRVLAASVGLVRCGFALSWPKTLWGAWLVLRANQRWAPYPDNDPDEARRLMTRFYRLAGGGSDFDAHEAARLAFTVTCSTQREATQRRSAAPSPNCTPTRTTGPSLPCARAASGAPRQCGSATRGSQPGAT